MSYNSIYKLIITLFHLFYIINRDYTLLLLIYYSTFIILFLIMN